jgi:predicted small lipoprotein YifL
MDMRLLLSALGCMSLLAACGYKGPLTRLDPADATMTKDARTAARDAERAQVEAGLIVPADARPVRVDELTVKLEARPDDLFNLPPEGTEGTRMLPFPGDPPPQANGTAAPAPTAAPNPVPAPE